MIQKKLQAPVEVIQSRCTRDNFCSAVVNKKSLDFLGFHILSDFLPTKKISALLCRLSREEGVKPIPHHPTRMACDDSWLEILLDLNEYKNLLSSGIFFDGNVAANLPCIFRKDQKHNNKVHLHNDLDYAMGGHERYSLFLALTKINIENGGLRIFPATHHFGSLGDCGEINPDVLPAKYPVVEPRLAPGDLLIMNSGTWHMSDESKVNKARVYLELHITHSMDASARYPLFGSPTSDFKNHSTSENIFLSSREQKLKYFYNSQRQ